MHYEVHIVEFAVKFTSARIIIFFFTSYNQGVPQRKMIRFVPAENTRRRKVKRG